MGKTTGENIKSGRESITSESRPGALSRNISTSDKMRVLKSHGSGNIFLVQIIIILTVSVAVYSNTLLNGFVYDDYYQVLHNYLITDIKYIGKIFFLSVAGFESGAITNYYRPLMHVIYMFNYHLFGLNPLGFHLVNILFHAGVSVLVFLVTSKILDGFYNVNRLNSHNNVNEGPPELISMPLIATLIFSTHPIHTEAVAWVAAVPELSFTFFYLLSFYLYVKSEGTFSRKYLFSVVSFSLATFCKEPALTLPFVLLAYDLVCRKTGASFFENLKRYLPFLVVGGAYLILRMMALGSFVPAKQHAELNTYQYVINIFPLFTQYIEKLIFPVNLNAFYVLHPIYSIFEMKGFISFVITVTFIAVVITASKKNKIVFLSLMFIGVPLLPVLYIPGLGENTFAERYLYLPSAGLAILLAWLLTWIKAKAPGSSLGFTAFFMVLIAVFFWGSFMRNGIWKNDLTLFADMVNKSPEGSLPHTDFATALLKEGKIDEAVEHYQIAIKLNLNNADAHYNLGVAYEKKGMLDDAIREYQLALGLSPNYAEARNNLGLAYEKKGLTEEAAKLYQLASNDPLAHNNLGVAYEKKGMLDDAIKEFKLALRLNPNYAEAHNNLGWAYEKKGMLDDAIEHLQTAIKLDPQNADSHNNLGMTYGKKGMLDDAIEHLQTAIKLDPQNADSHNNLGTAFFIKGLMDEAITQYQIALTIDPSYKKARSNLETATKKKGQH